MHFEGRDKSCDETIPLAEYATRIRVRSKKGSIDESFSGVAARHVKLEPIDVNSATSDEDEDMWQRGFVIQRSEEGVLVHTCTVAGEMITHSQLNERTRPCSNIGPLPVNLGELAAHYSADFFQLVDECDAKDSDDIWRVAFALKRPKMPSNILVHYAGTTQDWDETIPAIDVAARLRRRSKIGPLGEVECVTIICYLGI